MRLHFSFAELQTAFGTERFVSLLSSVMAEMCLPDLLHHFHGLLSAHCMSLLSPWRPERRCRSSRVTDFLSSCCLLPAWLPHPAELLWSSNETQQKCPKLWHPMPSISLGIKVAKSVRFPSCLRSPTGSFTVEICSFNSSPYDIIHLTVSLLLGSTSVPSQTVQTACICCHTKHTHTLLLLLLNECDYSCIMSTDCWTS